MSRADRVAELIKKEVSDIISRKLSDPRIGFTSITAVDIGPDLHNANIFVSIFGTDEQKTSTMKALEHATGFVRGELGHRLQLRDVPEIRFMRDDSIERGARVFEIINKLHKEEELKELEVREVKEVKRKKGKKGKAKRKCKKSSGR